jgi:hypothetical protein
LKSEEKSELHFQIFLRIFLPNLPDLAHVVSGQFSIVKSRPKWWKNQKKPEFARVTGGDPVGIISWNEGSGGAKMGAGTDHRGGDGRKKRPWELLLKV